MFTKYLLNFIIKINNKIYIYDKIIKKDKKR